MKKTEKILLILLLVLTLVLAVPKLNLMGEKSPDRYAYTKALCDQKGYCEDFFIECEGENLVRFSPTGFAIQTENQENKKSNEEFCD